MNILTHKNQVVIDHEITAANARQYRKSKNVSLKPLAAAMDVSICYLSLLERGKTAWSESRATAFEAAVERIAKRRDRK